MNLLMRHVDNLAEDSEVFKKLTADLIFFTCAWLCGNFVRGVCTKKAFSVNLMQRLRT